jgi:hypothetical protein
VTGRGTGGYAAAAGEYLTAAAEGVKLALDSYPSWNGFLVHPHRQEDDPARQLLALAGIGQALLALDDLLGAVVDAADDRNTQLDRIADAAGMLRREPRRTPRQWLSGLAWRWWGARRAERAWRRAHVWSQLTASTLTDDDFTVIRLALAEGDERHRALGASDGCAECGRLDPGKCAEHAPDAALADLYGGLWARLAGSDAS